MTAAEVASGLVLPNAASALLGKAGAVLALLMVFMAVTSAMSAELIAVSTIATYDIYRTYINPNASGKIDLGFPFVNSYLCLHYGWVCHWSLLR